MAWREKEADDSTTKGNPNQLSIEVSEVGNEYSRSAIAKLTSKIIDVHARPSKEPGLF